MKPREKLIKFGAKNLLDEELIAILLRTGSTKDNVLSLAKKVLVLIDGLDDIKNITVDDLLTTYGIQVAKATTIIAAVELGRRLEHKNRPKRSIIGTSEDVYYMLSEEMSYLTKEHLIVLCLDIKGQVIKNETIYIGTSSSVQIAIKDLYKSAVRIGAFGIIVVHNHPSGDAKPSHADEKLTDMMKEAGKILSIELIDHIIIGKDQYYSFRQQRKIKI